MIGLSIFVMIVISIIAYFLFAPIYIEINSIKEFYGIRFHRLLQAELYFKGDIPMLDFKFMGLSKQTRLFDEQPEEKEPTAVNKTTTINKKKRQVSIKQIFSIIGSFRVHKLHLNVCMNNMPLNGILYPCFRLMSIKTGKDLNINFLNRNEIILEIENNFYRILRAYLIN